MPSDPRVDAEDRAARDDVGDVDQLPALADVAPLRPGLELERLGVGRGQRRRPLGQLAVSEAATAGPMVDEVRRGLALRRRNAPGLRRGVHEHAPCRGAHPSHRLEEVADAVGAVGVLAAVALVSRGLDDAHAVEVGVHLVGHDHRQRRPDPLTHLGAVGHDLHPARGVERQEQVEAKGARVAGGGAGARGAQAEDERSRRDPSAPGIHAG